MEFNWNCVDRNASKNSGKASGAWKVILVVNLCNDFYLPKMFWDLMAVRVQKQFHKQVEWEIVTHWREYDRIVEIKWATHKHMNYIFAVETFWKAWMGFLTLCRYLTVPCIPM